MTGGYRGVWGARYGTQAGGNLKKVCECSVRRELNSCILGGPRLPISCAAMSGSYLERPSPPQLPPAVPSVPATSSKAAQTQKLGPRILPPNRSAEYFYNCNPTPRFSCITEIQAFPPKLYINMREKKAEDHSLGMNTTRQG